MESILPLSRPARKEVPVVCPAGAALDMRGWCVPGHPDRGIDDVQEPAGLAALETILLPDVFPENLFPFLAANHGPGGHSALLTVILAHPARSPFSAPV